MGENRTGAAKAAAPATGGRWLLHTGHLGLFNLIASLAWLGAALVVYSNLNVSAAGFLLLATAGLLVLLAWSVGAIGLLSTSYAKPPTEPWRRVSVTGSIALPLCLGAFVLLASFHVPRLVRFKLSEAALESYAREVQTGVQPEGPKGAWVGLIRVHAAHFSDHCVELKTWRSDGGPPWRWGGFAYGTAEQCPPPDYQHLSGDWWTWERQYPN